VNNDELKSDLLPTITIQLSPSEARWLLAQIPNLPFEDTAAHRFLQAGLKVALADALEKIPAPKIRSFLPVRSLTSLDGITL